MAEATEAFVASAPRPALFTYASRSATRCSRDGDVAGVGDAVSADKEEPRTSAAAAAMITVRARWLEWNIRASCTDTIGKGKARTGRTTRPRHLDDDTSRYRQGSNLGSARLGRGFRHLAETVLKKSARTRDGAPRNFA